MNHHQQRVSLLSDVLLTQWECVADVALWWQLVGLKIRERNRDIIPLQPLEPAAPEASCFKLSNYLSHLIFYLFFIYLDLGPFQSKDIQLIYWERGTKSHWFKKQNTKLLLRGSATCRCTGIQGQLSGCCSLSPLCSPSPCPHPLSPGFLLDERIEINPQIWLGCKRETGPINLLCFFLPYRNKHLLSTIQL